MGEHRDLNTLTAGDEVDGVYRLKHLVARQTPQGKDFLLGELLDRSGQIGFVWWQAAAQDRSAIQDARYLRVVGSVSRHRERLQLVLTRARPVAEDQIDPQRYQRTGDIDPAVAWNELEALVAGLDDPWIRQLLEAVFADPEIAAAYRQAPAAVTMHHAWDHGLLEHSLAVARLAEDCCRRYPQLDRSLLVAGALLHDLCKIEELSWDGQLGYTTRGNLVGHVVLGAVLIDRVSRTIADFPDRTREKLQHLVLSHHGELDHGAAREPMLLEAVVLHLIDNLDSRIAGFVTTVAQSTSTDPDWTEPARMFGRRLYRGD